jgi:hypothetical protein
MHVGSRANRRALIDEEKAKVFGDGVALGIKSTFVVRIVTILILAAWPRAGRPRTRVDHETDSVEVGHTQNFCS